MTTISLAGPLADVLPPELISTEPGILAEHSIDRSGWGDGQGPAVVVHPESVAQVQAVLRFATEHDVPVVTRGAGTGLAGGAAGTAGSIVLVTGRLNRIIELSAVDQLAVVEAGVITAELDATARRFGLFYPPDPASHTVSTIGGNVATNTGGLHCVKYGVTRDSVLALDVVLADGRLLRTGHRTVKGVTGLDLTALFVGSEGTLGVVVGATVRLRPLPAGQATLVAVFDTVQQAADGVAALATAPVSPAVCELLGEAAVASLRKRSALDILRRGRVLLLVQADGYGADAEAAVIADTLRRRGGTVSLAGSAAQAEELLDLRRSWGIDPDRRRVIGEDIAVPRSQLVEILTELDRISRRHGFEHSVAAHAGDGNLHPSFDVLADDPRSAAELEATGWAAADELISATLRLGGTITGEHGVGVLKRRWLRDELGDENVALQRSLKAVFDPLGILNPGKVY